MARTRAAGWGELESQILAVLRGAEEPLRAKQIGAALPGPERAYTTLMTVLHRLEDKGQVVRHTHGRKLVTFTAAATDAPSAGDRMAEELLSSADREAALLRFAGNLDSSDVATLMQAFGRDS